MTAWVLSQHGGSYQSFDNCAGSGAVPILLIGIAALSLIGIGAWLALRVWREREAAQGARRFIAGMGLGIAALMAIAIILQTAGSLIIPKCFG
jgi:hypothetical protein